MGSFPLVLILYFYGCGVLAANEDTNFDSSGNLKDIFAAARTAAELQKSQQNHAEVISNFFYDTLKSVSIFDIMKELQHLFSNRTSRCSTNMQTYLKKLLEKQHWALQMADATGKPRSGIMTGNLVWAGNFQQCISTEAVGIDKSNTSKLLFNARYCSVILSSKNITNRYDEYYAVKIGVCLPDSCLDGDVESVLEFFSNRIHKFSPKLKFVYKARCHNPRSSIRLTSDAIGMLCFLTLLILVCLLASLYDILVRPRTGRCRSSSTRRTSRFAAVPPHLSNDGDARDIENVAQVNERRPLLSSPESETSGSRLRQCLILAFSFPNNVKKILNTRTQEGTLGCLHGIRFISMSWVILGHVYIFSLGSISNMFSLVLNGSLKEFSFQAVANASLSVDSFFLMSGFLTSYLFLRERLTVGRIKKMNWPMFYVHRFWRLTPAYMLVIGTYTAFYKYLFDGPFWPQDVGLGDSCHENWWRNLLYINNLFSNQDACMSWSWYLANDMQFYIISPLFLIPIALNATAGLGLSILGILASMIARIVISREHKYGIGFAGNMDETFFDLMYQRPWTRIAPFIIGIIGGYVIHCHRRRIHMPKWVVVLGWCLAAALALSVVYGPYDSNRGAVVLNVKASAIYNGTFRIAWSLAVLWVIIACVTGHGGWVNDFLSWKLFMPLARLTYLAYLVHPVVIMAVSNSRLETTQWDNVTVSYMFIGHMVISYAVAFIGSLLFESPFMGIERALRHR